MSVTVELVAGYDDLRTVREGEGGVACEGNWPSFSVRWVEAAVSCGRSC